MYVQYVLHWSYMARPSSLQSITANDMTLHGKGCGHVSVELHVVVSANVKNNYNNLLALFNCFIALKAKCHPLQVLLG